MKIYLYSNLVQNINQFDWIVLSGRQKSILTGDKLWWGFSKTFYYSNYTYLIFCSASPEILHRIRHTLQCPLCARPLSVSFRFMRRSHLLADQLLGEYTLDMAATLALLLQRIILGKTHIASAFTLSHPSFMQFQSHRHNSIHPSPFISWGVLWCGSFLTCFGTVPSGTPITEVSYSMDHVLFRW